MNRTAKRTAWRVSLALVLGLAAWAGADRLRLIYSPTTDEPIHVGAARELRYGPGVVTNFEHPLLMKIVAGAALPAREAPDSWDDVRRARRPFPALYGAFVALASLWAIGRLGVAAGAAYGALLVLEPTLRGHAALVHTDILFTSLLGVTVILLDQASRSARWQPQLLCAAGVACGLALSSKHSALLIFPFVAVVGSLLVWWRARREPGAAGAFRQALHLAVFPGVAVLLFLFIQLAGASRTDRREFVSAAKTVYGGLAGPGVVGRVAQRLPVGAASYAIGALQVRASAAPGNRYYYFFGRASGTGWLAYFPVALSLKLTAATVLLILLGLFLASPLGARAEPGGSSRRSRLLHGLVFLPLAIGGAYFGMASLSRLNIGVRHVLPAVPLVLFAALAGVRIRLAARPVLRAAVLLVVVAGAALEAAAHSGREISFGNVLAGGPAGLRKVLSDSNTDWGQRQDRVYSRMARGDLGRAGIVSIFFDMDRAAARGLSPVPLGDDEAVARLDSAFVSIYLLDLLQAMETNEDRYLHYQAARRNLSPWIRRIASRARATEPVGDEYVLFRLR